MTSQRILSKNDVTHLISDADFVATQFELRNNYRAYSSWVSEEDHILYCQNGRKGLESLRSIGFWSDEIEKIVLEKLNKEAKRT